jgi:hypothetical protein
LSPKANLASQHFDATKASSPQPCRPVTSHDVDYEQPNQAPRLSFRALQHIRPKVPFLPLQVTPKRLRNSAQFPRSPALRVWLPSLRCQPLRTSETSFSPQRSWASPFKAFLLPHDRITLSNNPSALALPYKTLPDLVNTLQRLQPTGKAVPLLLLPRGLIWAGAACSLGLCDLLGSLLSLTHEVSISLTPSPSRP